MFQPSVLRFWTVGSCVSGAHGGKGTYNMFPQKAFQGKVQSQYFKPEALQRILKNIFLGSLFQGDRGCGPKEKGAKAFSV